MVSNELKYKIFNRLYDYYHKTNQISKSSVFLDSINQYLEFKLEQTISTANELHNTKLELINS